MNLGDTVRYNAPNGNTHILKVMAMRPVGRGFRVECMDSKGNEHTIPASQCEAAPEEAFQFNSNVPVSVKKKAMTPEEMKQLRRDLRNSGKAAVVPDLSRYVKNAVSKDNGDKVSMMLRDCTDSTALYKKAISLGLKATEAELEDRYNHLNFGMQRMNIGNRLRSIVR